MRNALFAAALVLAGTAAASAQPWDGPGGWAPSRPAYGPPPSPRHFGPPPQFAGQPVRCWWREGHWGPRRVCREVW